MPRAVTEAPVPGAAASHRCGYCRTALPLGAQRCHGCGNLLPAPPLGSLV